MTRYITFRKNVFISSATIFILLLLSPIHQALAQTFENNMAFSLAYPVLSEPAEKPFETETTIPGFIFDWDFDDAFLKFRVGYNSLFKSKTEFNAYDKTWKGKLKTNTIYLAYRYTLEIMTALESYATLGLAQFSSELEFNHGAGKVQKTGLGGVLGIGALYQFNDMAFGLQIDIFSREETFEDSKLAVGSNQLQAIASYSF